MNLDNKEIKKICLEASCQKNSIICTKGLGNINLGDETSFCIASYYKDLRIITTKDKMFDCPYRQYKK